MAIVLMVSEEGTTKAYTLTRSPIIAGRSQSCDIILYNVLCSSEHCQFVLTESGQAKVMDLGSTNGVSVNGSSTLHCKLFLGDEIYMGDAKAWLDDAKMTFQEKQVHSKDTALKRHPAKPVIKLPPLSKNEKTGKLLASGPSSKEAKSNPHKTSTAVRNVRKARAIINKKKES
ncbi:MAG: FHA domain-containing protein [Bdellovibrio sp.]|nr:FHA domain-containing protein [Bdellovibrio sp.]